MSRHRRIVRSGAALDSAGLAAYRARLAASFGFPAASHLDEPARRNLLMAWLILGVAVVTEIIWALSLKWAAMRPGLLIATIPIALSFVNMGLLALAMRGLPAGTAYAVWTGLGAVGVTVLGVVLFGETLNMAQLGFIALIIVGVVGTKFFAAT
jgi:quaternary ammonium compound-resistance protein SugE